MGGIGAWLWQANAYETLLAKQAETYVTEREAAVVAVLDQLQQDQERRRALEDRLQADEKTKHKELRDAQKARDRLRDRLATADLRLSVLLAAAQGGGGGVSAATCACGVVHGGSRAELDPAHAQRIVAITGDGDEGLIALAACQAYVRNARQ
ncbi:lysis system i-spanin subunit Rz [Pseudomonas palmensis]|uniref:lysis system i-spanin subunit Rz n=1 Tax=Pseudomonas palmensis TaxID=2815362 RepID=UPI001AE2744A|nr:lysis system i-spanin subunit Rz [Pseudomonas palmensis]